MDKFSTVSIQIVNFILIFIVKPISLFSMILRILPINLCYTSSKLFLITLISIILTFNLTLFLIFIISSIFSILKLLTNLFN
jgi:hypothetical protein